MECSLFAPLLWFTIALVSGQQPWDDLNCAAPRSPRNGLSFIFKEGREVHFKCHPGFHLIGSTVSKCVNNRWDTPVPNCLPEKANLNETTMNVLNEDHPEKVDSDRQLFSWDSPGLTPDPSPEPGSRRLPLINGLWRPSYEYNRPQIDGAPKRQVPSANKTRDLYHQELGIAEVRHKQQMEVQSNSVLRGAEHFPRSSRPTSQQNAQEAELRRWRLNQARQSPNILYAGSRAASAYRGETGEEVDLETGETVMNMFDLDEAPREPEEEIHQRHQQYTSHSYRLEPINRDLIELRQRQIAETLRNQMASKQRGSSGDKAGLVEDARRRQYEELQLIRSSSRTRPPYYPQSYYIPADAAAASDYTFARRPILGDDNDQLQVSSSEMHAQKAIPKDESSTYRIQSDPTMHTIIFKPIAIKDDKTDTIPYRGDMGTPDTMLDYTEAYPTKIPAQKENKRRPLFENTSTTRSLFSPEKAGQVEATIRQFLRPRPQVFVHTVYYPPPTVPTYPSHLVPRTTKKPVVIRPRPTQRPVSPPPTRSPLMESNGDKAAQTEELMYQQYLQAEHLRRIMEYERDRLDWERRQEWERRNMMMEERERDSNRRQMLSSEDEEVSDEVLVQRPEEIYFSSNDSDGDLDYANRVEVLASIDREWLSQLSPDLQAKYLEEVLRSRTKESDESHYAQEFMRRHMDSDISGNSTFPNVSTRTSSTGHVTTIIQSQSASGINATIIAKADLSCLQSRSGRRLFIRAPKVPFAFVHRYERRKHVQAPFKPYLVAEYKCRRGFALAQPRNRSLFCRRMEWAGEKPECVKSV